MLKFWNVIMCTLCTERRNLFASIEPEYVKVFQSGFMYNREKEKPNSEPLERIQYLFILDFV